MKHLFILLMLISIVSCETKKADATSKQEQKHQTDTPIAQDITAEEFKALIEMNTGFLIDVRTPNEFNNGSIDGAKNIDFLNAQFLANIKTLETSQPIYVYCQAGGRSSKAMKVLEQNGFTEIYNLIGGYGQWPFK